METFIVCLPVYLISSSRGQILTDINMSSNPDYRSMAVYITVSLFPNKTDQHFMIHPNKLPERCLGPFFPPIYFRQR